MGISKQAASKDFPKTTRSHVYLFILALASSRLRQRIGWSFCDWRCKTVRWMPSWLRWLRSGTVARTEPITNTLLLWIVPLFLAWKENYLNSRRRMPGAQIYFEIFAIAKIIIFIIAHFLNIKSAYSVEMCQKYSSSWPSFFFLPLSLSLY